MKLSSEVIGQLLNENDINYKDIPSALKQEIISFVRSYIKDYLYNQTRYENELLGTLEYTLKKQESIEEGEQNQETYIFTSQPDQAKLQEVLESYQQSQYVGIVEEYLREKFAMDKDIYTATQDLLLKKIEKMQSTYEHYTEKLKNQYIFEERNFENNSDDLLSDIKERDFDFPRYTALSKTPDTQLLQSFEEQYKKNLFGYQSFIDGHKDFFFQDLFERDFFPELKTIDIESKTLEEQINSLLSSITTKVVPTSKSFQEIRNHLISFQLDGVKSIFPFDLETLKKALEDQKQFITEIVEQLSHSWEISPEVKKSHIVPESEAIHSHRKRYARIALLTFLAASGIGICKYVSKETPNNLLNNLDTQNSYTLKMYPEVVHRADQDYLLYSIGDTLKFEEGHVVLDKQEKNIALLANLLFQITRTVENKVVEKISYHNGEIEVYTQDTTIQPELHIPLNDVLSSMIEEYEFDMYALCQNADFHTIVKRLYEIVYGKVDHKHLIQVGNISLIYACVLENMKQYKVKQTESFEMPVPNCYKDKTVTEGVK